MKKERPAVFDDENIEYTTFMRYANNFISEALVNSFKKHIPPDTKRLLDAGCGSGEVTMMIADYLRDFSEIHGIDLSNPHIDESNKLLKKIRPDEKRILFKQGDISALDKYPDNYFDIIWTSNALTHVTNMKKTVDGFKRILKDDGKILAFQAEVMNHLFLPWERDLEIRMEDAFWKLNKSLYPTKNFYFFTDMVGPFMNHGFKEVKVDAWPVVKKSPLSEKDTRFVEMFFRERYMNPQIRKLYSPEDWAKIKKYNKQPFYKRDDFFTIFVLTACIATK